MSRHVARVVVMDGIGQPDPPADNRRVVANVGVFEPMDKPGGEPGGKDGGNELGELA
jgi:hypothetical protein